MKISIDEKVKKYGCNGECYENGYCQNIDICPETKNTEFIGTVVASLIMLSIPIVVVIAVTMMII